MVKKSLYITCIVVLSVICVTQLVFESDSTSQQVIVDSDESVTKISAISVIDGLTADELIEGFQNLEDGKIALISGPSLDMLMYSDPLMLKNIIKSGTPMIIKGDVSIISTVGTSIVLNPNADCNAVYRDISTGTTYCFLQCYHLIARWYHHPIMNMW